MKIAMPIVTLERIAHTLQRMPNKEKPAPLTPKGAAPRCHPRPIAEVVCYSSAPTSRKNISAPPATVSASLAALAESARDENQSASSAAVSDFRGHQAVLEDFLAAIQQNRAPACDGAEGRRSIALIESIYRAAKTPDREVSV